VHEEVFVGAAREALAHFESPRGEIVLVLEGSDESQREDAVDEASLREEIRQMRALGLSRRQAAALLGQRYGASRRQLYALWLETGT
jgi:16S rRNA C1402 (ribose-2'-O) methylase RsmI